MSCACGTCLGGKLSGRHGFTDREHDTSGSARFFYSEFLNAWTILWERGTEIIELRYWAFRLVRQFDSKLESINRKFKAFPYIAYFKLLNENSTFFRLFFLNKTDNISSEKNQYNHEFTFIHSHKDKRKQTVVILLSPPDNCITLSSVRIASSWIISFKFSKTKIKIVSEIVVTFKLRNKNIEYSSVCS